MLRTLTLVALTVVLTLALVRALSGRAGSERGDSQPMAGRTVGAPAPPESSASELPSVREREVSSGADEPPAATTPETGADEHEPLFEFEGRAYRQSDLDAMNLDSLRELKSAMKKKAGITDKLLEIRRRPREALDLMTGAEYEARDMRWTDELCTYYLGDPEVKILHIRRNEDPEIYDHARRMGQIYGARAFQEHLRSRRRTFEADVRARYPGVDITFVESVRGLSVFAYRSDDVRGELLGAIETSEF